MQKICNFGGGVNRENVLLSIHPLSSITSGAFLARDRRSEIHSLSRGVSEKRVQSVESSSAT